MSKNFDQEYAQDLTFTIGGETFTAALVRPEALQEWESDTNGKTPTYMEQIEILDKRVKVFLKDGDKERWDALRAREEDPISQAQINGLVLWLLEVNTERPTNPPSPSGAGRGKTGV